MAEKGMTLREKRCHFSSMLAELVLYANSLEYEVAINCVKCFQPGHHMKNSLHYDGLAADLNLYRDGQWLSDGTGHDALHDYWDSIGGAERIAKDLNHYSYKVEGRR